LSLGVVLWLLAPVTHASAGSDRVVVVGAGTDASDAPLALAAAPKTPDASEATPAAKPDDKVKVPKDKPKRSKKNPNDDKDEDPDDGNAGGGNDDKTLPNDGPERD
jgi:hypothetical protein